MPTLDVPAPIAPKGEVPSVGPPSVVDPNVLIDPKVLVDPNGLVPNVFVDPSVLVDPNGLVPNVLVDPNRLVDPNVLVPNVLVDPNELAPVVPVPSSEEASGGERGVVPEEVLDDDVKPEAVVEVPKLGVVEPPSTAPAAGAPGRVMTDVVAAVGAELRPVPVPVLVLVLVLVEVCAVAGAAARAANAMNTQ